MTLLNLLPTWLIFCLAVLVVGILSITVTRFMRKIGFFVKFKDGTTVTTFFSIVATLESIVLAFIVVAVWQQFDSTDKVVSTEAVALTSLYRDTDWLQSEQKNIIKNAIVNYTKSVIDFDYPQMKYGRLSLEGDRALQELFRAYETLEKETATRESILAQTLSQLNIVAQSRVYRLNQARSEVPTTLYVVLIIGGIFTISIGAIVPMEHWTLHTWLNVIYAITGALLLALAFVMDHPFSGDFSISTKVFEDALKFYTAI